MRRSSEAAQDGRNLGKQDVLEAAAVEAGLDLEKFREDLASDEVFSAVEEDYIEGRKLGVFGTPTIMFENGEGAYLQVDFRELAEGSSHVLGRVRDNRA